jgi:urocanate hydratase
MNNLPQPATGSRLRCKGWRQEGILRMLENTLANAESPENLIVYGSTGQAARDWESYHKIVESLKRLGDDETLVVQSGKPVAVFRTFTNSPRVVLATCNLVPRYATREELERLRQLGLTIHGQYTAASWAYIGSQGIMQGTYETFGACAARYFGGDLTGRVVLTGGLGGMGSSQAPAVSMNNGVVMVVEIDLKRIRKRLLTRHIDESYDDFKIAWRRCREAATAGKPLAVGLHANAADIMELVAESDDLPDCITDQTSAHDLLRGYVPSGLSVDEAAVLRERDPKEYLRRSEQTVVRHLRAMLKLQGRGVVAFEYGNNLRGAALESGFQNAFDLPGFMPLFIRASFARGRGPFRWVLLSGDVKDQAAVDRAAMELFPEDDLLQRWLRLAPERVPLEGLPARTCWLGYGDRRKMATRINEMVRSGEISAPVAITRDHLDSGACAFPRRENEKMPDGSDMIADWPYLNALLNTSAGADQVAIHQNGGDIGGSVSAGMTVICDGSDGTFERIARVFETDPGIGVVRHADAGVPEAVEFLARSGIVTP